MRCRWRRDPTQRRLMPRLRANLRAMTMLALILAGGRMHAWRPVAPRVHCMGFGRLLRPPRGLAVNRSGGLHAGAARFPGAPCELSLPPCPAAVASSNSLLVPLALES